MNLYSLGKVQIERVFFRHAQAALWYHGSYLIIKRQKIAQLSRPIFSFFSLVSMR